MGPRPLLRFTAAALACLLCTHVPRADAAGQVPALDRPALQVRHPQRGVLLSAAMAGSRVVAVGERGLVLLSDDSGANWRQAKGVPVSVTLTAVRFVDAERGWAVGHSGVILRSSDGGESWTRQADGRTLAKLALQAAEQQARSAPSDAAAARRLKAAQLLVDDGPDKPLLDVNFTDAQRGMVIGAYNLFFATADGGATWTSVMDRLDNPKSLHLYAIRAEGPHLYIVGEQGLMFRSQDSGQTFQRLTPPYGGSWFALAALPNGGLVAAGLRGNAFFSSDRGSTWARIEGSVPASFVSATALADGSVLLANQAGQLMSSRAGGPLTSIAVPSLPPLADVLPMPGGGWLALGLGGAIRVAPTAGTLSGATQ